MRQIKRLLFRLFFVIYYVIGIPLYVLSWALYGAILPIYGILSLPVWVLFGENVWNKSLNYVYLPNYRELFGWRTFEYRDFPLPMWFPYYREELWFEYIGI